MIYENITLEISEVNQKESNIKVCYLIQQGLKIALIVIDSEDLKSIETNLEPKKIKNQTV